MMAPIPKVDVPIDNKRKNINFKELLGFLDIKLNTSMVFDEINYASNLIKIRLP